jgi:hypothetical protein
MRVWSPGLTVGLALLALVGGFGCAAAAVNARHREGSVRRMALQAVMQTIGIPALAVTAETLSTRNPGEGLGGCLGDIPGGYSCHDACDVVTYPGVVERAAVLEAVVADL